MNKQVYVTTSIPYVNAHPHIGFALELVQADVIARYNRLIGNVVRFQTGTDENAFKNVLSAREQGITVQQLVDQNSQVFRNLCVSLNISQDNFIRTTSAQHRTGVYQFWNLFRPEDIYVDRYTGLYCNGCEDFCLERELVNGCCADHGAPPVKVEEENYFFRLSAYQEQIRTILETDRVKVVPEKRKNEVLSFVRRGLQDISISRPAERSGGWGIPVPGDQSQVIYVWLDALINYLSGLGFGSGEDWKEHWNEQTAKIHVIGKNVWKFHAVYWPAFLLSTGFPLPDEIIVHGFLTVEGQKLSKSRGNVIDPFDCIDKFGADTVRYYLLRGVTPFDDGDFSEQKLVELYNAELANGLGNLASRLTALCDKGKYGQYIPDSAPPPPEGYSDALARYGFHDGVKTLSAIVTKLNQDIDRVKPWEILKQNSHAPLHQTLTEWLKGLHRVAYWLAPFLPEASGRVLRVLATNPLTRCQVLFPRTEGRA